MGEGWVELQETLPRIPRVGTATARCSPARHHPSPISPEAAVRPPVPHVPKRARARVPVYMFSTIAAPNSLVLSNVDPGIRRSKSYVTRFCAIVSSSERTINSAASGHPM